MGYGIQGKSPAREFAVSAIVNPAADRNLVTIWNQGNTRRKIEIFEVDVGIATQTAVIGFNVGVQGMRVNRLSVGSTGSVRVVPMDTADGSLHGNIRVRADPGGSIAPAGPFGVGSVFHFAVVNPEETGGVSFVRMYEAKQYETPIVLRGSQGYTLRQYNKAGVGSWLINIRMRVGSL